MVRETADSLMDRIRLSVSAGSLEPLLKYPPMAFWVEASACGGRIVDDCENVIQTGTLKCENQDDTVAIQYGPEGTRVDLDDHAAEPHMVLCKLNRLLGPDWEIRLCLGSRGQGHRLAFAILSPARWMELPPETGIQFCPLSDQHDFFTASYYMLPAPGTVYTSLLLYSTPMPIVGSVLHNWLNALPADLRTRLPWDYVAPILAYIKAGGLMATDMESCLPPPGFLVDPSDAARLASATQIIHLRTAPGSHALWTALVAARCKQGMTLDLATGRVLQNDDPFFTAVPMDRLALDRYLAFNRTATGLTTRGMVRFGLPELRLEAGVDAELLLLGAAVALRQAVVQGHIGSRLHVQSADIAEAQGLPLDGLRPQTWVFDLTWMAERQEPDWPMSLPWRGVLRLAPVGAMAAVDDRARPPSAALEWLDLKEQAHQDLAAAESTRPWVHRTLHPLAADQVPTVDRETARYRIYRILELIRHGVPHLVAAEGQSHSALRSAMQTAKVLAEDLGYQRRDFECTLFSLILDASRKRDAVLFKTGSRPNPVRAWSWVWLRVVQASPRRT